MTKVTIDGVEYVPRGSIPPLTDERLKAALQELTAIQYFHECTGKHRAWAWDALNALAPELAQLPAKEAFERVRDPEDD
jgi:hypothetical protein